MPLLPTFGDSEKLLSRSRRTTTRRLVYSALVAFLLVGKSQLAPADETGESAPPTLTEATSPPGLLAASVIEAASGEAATPKGADAPTSGTQGNPGLRPSCLRDRRKLLSAAAVGASYAAFGVWAYFAWFRGAPTNKFHFINPWFGRNEYAGGADSMGHMWANHMFSRVNTEFLMQGGWGRLPSSIAGSSLTLFFFTLSEIKDGFVWGFEYSDELFNAVGAAFSLLQVNVPAIDALLDFRLEYVPTHEYLSKLRDGNLDFAQDYSGQSYMLAVHVGAVPGLTDSRWTRWARFIDVVGGFESRNYIPVPSDPNAVPRQTLFLGLALNMQHVLETLFCDSTGRRVGHLTFELLSPPYTTLRIGEASRSPD